MKRLFLGGLAAAALPLAAGAAEPADPAEAPLTITITGTRTEQPLAHATAATTVVTAADIERTQAQSVSELLNGLTGVDVASSGGAGKVTSLYLRGSNSGHTLLLIDGVRVGSATLGAPAWQNLPLGVIDRIEIVRGPQSGLYGSDAIGGVVQIFTKKGEGEPRAWGSAALGSPQGVDALLGYGGRVDDTRFSLALGHYDTEGFNATTPENFGYNPDRDGYHNTFGHLSVTREFAPGQSFGVTLLRAQGNNAYDGFPPEAKVDGDFVQQVVSIQADNRLNDVWRMKTLVGQSQDRAEEFVDDFSIAEFNTRRDQFTWQHDLSLGRDHTLSLGYDYQKERVSGTSVQDYSQRTRDDNALFVSDTLRLGDVDLQASLRSDDYDDLGRHNTGRFGAGWQFTPSSRLTASYGTGYKAPSFNDLYYPDTPFAVGNPDLRPESSRSWDLGFEQTFVGVQWRAALFHSRVEDLINWAPDANFKFRPDNVDRARLRGVELGASAHLDGWQLALNLDLLDAEDARTGRALPNRPDRTLRLDVDRDFGAWSGGATVFAASYPSELPQTGYALLNLRAGYRLDRDWTLKAKVNNVFDRDYQTVEGYAMPGREAWLAIEYGL